MSEYFKSIRDLPTIVINGYQTNQWDKGATNLPIGTLGKRLGKPKDGKVKCLFYGPDLGYDLRGEGITDKDDFVTLDIKEGSFKEPQLNTLDVFVRRGLLRYPSLYAMREDVLAHAYLVLGSGMEWDERGQLRDRTAREKSKRPDMRLESELPEDWNMRAFYDGIIEHHPEFAEEYTKTRAEALEKHLAETKAENAVLRHRDLYIDHYATVRSKLNLTPSHYNNATWVCSYIDSGYLPFSNIPERVDPNFLDGAIEILKKAVASTPHSYAYHEYNNRNWKPDPNHREPRWVRLQAETVAKAKAEEGKTEEDLAKIAKQLAADKENVYRACRRIDWDIIPGLTTKRININWGYANLLIHHLTAIGFKERPSLHSTNGSGSVLVWRAKRISEEQIDVIAADLKAQGFKRRGMVWNHALWPVRLGLIREGKTVKLYRPQILIITHPEDDSSRIETMEKSWETGWSEHEEYRKRKIAKDKAQRAQEAIWKAERAAKKAK